MKHYFLAGAAALALFSFSAGASFAEEPALPIGLGGTAEAPSSAASSDSDMPALPAGLGGASHSASSSDDDGMPSLPSGLADLGGNGSGSDTGSASASSGTASDSESGASFTDRLHDFTGSLPFELTGFAEMRGGVRVHDQNYEKRTSIGEERLQLQMDKYWNNVTMRVTSDFVADQVADHYPINLDTGAGWIDLREAYLSWRATSFMDIKAGRQVLTWGTGDFLFLNDMFPKDYDSFFIGRDDEYLKAPSDALKTSFFSDLANLDLVYSPHFNAARYNDGSRISIYNPLVGAVAGNQNILDVDPRSDWFSEDEWAARLYRNFGAYETALYAYNGYWKTPQGLDMSNSRAFFPRLSTYGGSVRGPVSKGIGNVEVAYYDSMDDRAGTNPLLPNSQFRFLAGYEQEIATELTGGIQYYVEHTMDYAALKRNAPSGSPLPRENRQVITVRLTKMLMNQDLTLSLFNFWSPNELDGYVRPVANYKINDQWQFSTGANIFYGQKRTTFFGQLEDNTNIYACLRYSF